MKAHSKKQCLSTLDFQEVKGFHSLLETTDGRASSALYGGGRPPLAYRAGKRYAQLPGQTKYAASPSLC